MMNALKESSVVYKTTSLFKLSNKKVKIDFSFSPKVNTKDFLNISKHLLEQRKKKRYIQTSRAPKVFLEALYTPSVTNAL